MGHITLLAIGDVHLGTQPSRLPENLDEAGLTIRDLGPEATLSRVVELAIRECVDAVLFAGDVVESTNARFEALRSLETSVNQLTNEGIPVLAVAGNHDVEALPRLASRIEGFTLLGESGSWKSYPLSGEGQPAVEIVGWSFPEREVVTNPLLSLHEFLRASSQDENVTRIGLLHADLDASGGRYAPVSRRELDESGLDAWLLGHIHIPSLMAENSRAYPLYGYLGSLVGLNPSETGPHGPWLVRISSDGTVSAEQVALAPLRWENLSMPVDEFTDPEDIGDAILDEAGRLPCEFEDKDSRLQALGVRVYLEGATSKYAQFHSWVEQCKWSDIQRQVGETLVFVHSVYSHFIPSIDLVDVASGADPPALIARKLLELQDERPGGRELIEAAHTELVPVVNDGRWFELDNLRDSSNPLSDRAIRDLLRQAATDILYKLLSQRTGDRGGSP